MIVRRQIKVATAAVGETGVLKDGVFPHFGEVAIGALVAIVRGRGVFNVTNDAVWNVGAVLKEDLCPIVSAVAGAAVAGIMRVWDSGTVTGAAVVTSDVVKGHLPVLGVVAAQARAIIVIGRPVIRGAALIRNQQGVIQALPRQTVKVVAIGAEAGKLDGLGFSLMAKAAHGDGETGMIKRGHLRVRFVIVTGDAGAGVVIRRLVPLVA